ncbi:MAG: alpha/beta fold hydrolase [Candidatus Thiothrix moscowensis]|nr:alpha/beta fold hydrolase [Candidatus Thiothrix moscowensis]
MIMTLILLLTGISLIGGLLLTAALVFGDPKPLPPLSGVSEPFNKVDFSDLPTLDYAVARDHTPLAYRHYPASSARGSVVLIHGSSANSRSMHVLAKAFASNGLRAYALDMRGHGASGQRGQIAYLGQLENDLSDWMQAVQPTQPCTLVGFSSGGGFTLRVAGSERQHLFQHYLLLAPFLGQDAPTYRPECGWISMGVPRMLALNILNGFGITAFNHLPVTHFALDPAAAGELTATYSFALATNFRPQADYRATIRAVRQPLRIIVGKADKVVVAEQFEPVFREAGNPIPITLLEGITHVQLILQPDAIASILRWQD